MGVAFDKTIAPDRAAMHAHVAALFGRAPSGLVELAWIDRRNNGMAHSGAQLFDLGSLDDLTAQAQAWNREKKNIYIGATLKTPSTAPFGRTSDSDAHAAWAYWLDLDEPGAPAQARTLAARLPPSLVVVTGTVPYEREHWWWLLDEPVADMAALRAQIGAIAGALGGDPRVVNPSRIMRLAGTVAWPVKPGRVPELVVLRGGDRVQYPAAAIEGAFPAGNLLITGSAGKSSERRPNIASISPAPTAAPAAPRTVGSLGILPAPLDDGRETYMRDTVLAVMRQLIGTTGAAPTPEELFDAAWPQYAAHVDLSRAGRGKDELAQKCVAAVRRFHAGKIQGMRTLEEAVASHRQKEAKNGRSSMSPVGDIEAEFPGGAKPSPEWADLARPFVLRPAAQIPRRRWLYGTSYIRSFVSVLASTGGAGKTTLYIGEALAIASGRPLLGIAPNERTGVWVLNLEDPADEMERRIAAAAQHHGLGQDDIAGRLFVDAGRDQPMTVAAQTRNGVEINVPIVDRIAAEIGAKDIGVLIVDPFVACHAVPENDNGAINAVLALWRHIADATHCCILLVHHVRKPNGEEMTADSIRGGSAIIGAVRTARVLNPMSEAEAAKLGIEPEQRRRYVRIDDAKNNLAPPASRASWLQLVSVELGNGGIGEGDKVGVCAPWSPPDAWDGVTGDHLLRAHKFLSEYGPQPSDIRNERWFGHTVIEILGLTPGAAAEAKTKAVLKGWMQSGALKEDKISDKKHGRREQPAFAAGNLSEAGMAA